MADSKITALTALTAADPANDMIPIVDVSDTPPASGNTKRISINNLLACSPSATLASATITGDLTVNTNVLKVDSTNDRVGIGTATPNWLLTASGSSPEFVMIDSGGNGTRLYTKTTNTAVFIGANYSTSAVPINFTLDGGSSNAMTLNSTGLGVGVVPSAGKGALQLSSGINFPATQVASSDANTLDDYKESTWTPVITAGSGTPTTVTINSAVYTKLGRVVVCTFDFSIVNKGTASSSLQFGLPVTSITSTAFCGSFREDAITGNMGMVNYSTGTTAACLLYNNATPWVDGYRLKGTYIYFAA